MIPPPHLPLCQTGTQRLIIAINQKKISNWCLAITGNNKRTCDDYVMDPDASLNRKCNQCTTLDYHHLWPQQRRKRSLLTFPWHPAHALRNVWNAWSNWKVQTCSFLTDEWCVTGQNERPLSMLSDYPPPAPSRHTYHKYLSKVCWCKE